MRLRGLKLAAVAVLSVAAAACGGGGGGEIASTPAPPPVQVQSYQKFGALTGEQRLDTSGYVINANDVTGVTKAQSTATDAVVITFQPATGTYLVRTPFAATASFGAADAVSPSSNLSDAFDYYQKTATVNGVSTSTRVALYKPKGGSGSAVPLTYTTLLQVIQLAVPGGPSTADLSWTYGGFATTSADMPKTGSGSYTGPAYAQYWLNAAGQREPLEGSLAVTANFGAGSVDTRILLNRFDYSTLSLSGTGTISSNFFEGALTGKGYSDANLTGRFSGQFMGPGAAELGLRFDVTDGAAAIMGVGAARK